MLNRVGRVLRATYTGTRGRKILNVKDPSASGLVEVEEGRGSANKKKCNDVTAPECDEALPPGLIICKNRVNNKQGTGHKSRPFKVDHQYISSH